MDETLILVFQLAVLLFSVIVHEVSHGAVAYKLGDDTAKAAGRLTLNPIKHLDLMGSFLVPLFLYLMSGGSFILGWAKPVPFNPLRLRNPNMGAAVIGAAGPLSNFTLAIIFGLLIRLLGPMAEAGGVFWAPVVFFFNIIVFTNVLLGIFNLVPIPPLDGSKLLYAFISDRYIRIKIILEQYGFFILLFFLMFGGFSIVTPIIDAVYRLIVGPWGIF